MTAAGPAPAPGVPVPDGVRVLRSVRVPAESPSLRQSHATREKPRVRFCADQFFIRRTRTPQADVEHEGPLVVVTGHRSVAVEEAFGAHVHVVIVLGPGLSTPARLSVRWAYFRACPSMSPRGMRAAADGPFAVPEPRRRCCPWAGTPARAPGNATHHVGRSTRMPARGVRCVRSATDVPRRDADDRKYGRCGRPYGESFMNTHQRPLRTAATLACPGALLLVGRDKQGPPPGMQSSSPPPAVLPSQATTQA
jgi:hypothetical protein